MNLRELLSEYTYGEIALAIAQTILAGFCIYALLAMLMALGA